MGSAASALNEQDGGIVTKDLKEKYQKYLEEKLSDEEIQEKLTKEYAKLVEEISSKHHSTVSTAPGTPAVLPGGTVAAAATQISSRKSSKENNQAEANSNPVKRRGSRDGTDDTISVKRKGSRDLDENRSTRTINNNRVTSPSMKGNLGSTKGGDDLTNKASARLAAKGSAKQTTASTRRRSFDVNQANKKPAPAPPVEAVNLASTSHDSNHSKSPKKSSNPPSLGGNVSDAALLNANEVLDSWDSVAQQPYCKICQMAFKSDAFLERHIKFSDLHTQNVKKLNGELEPPKLPEPAPDQKLLAKQVEGEHYKLLYTGSKFFWRTQDTIDLHFYLHILPNVLEVISYDTVKSKETNRIYFDYDRLTEIIKKHPNLNWIEGDEEAKRTAITTFLLQRLQLENGSSTAGLVPDVLKNNTILAFTRLTGDDFNSDPKSPYAQRTPVLEKAPIVLIPINVTRRRRTNAEEIDTVITNLTNDRAALVAATDRAEKVAHLVYAGATAIASKKWYSDFNPIRKRWIMAIRRVIRIKHVAVTTQFLRELELKKEQDLRAGKRNSMELPTKSKSKEI